MRLFLQFGRSLLLVANVEAVHQGHVEAGPGDEEPGPERDGPDGPAPGEEVDIDAWVDRGFGKEDRPGKDLRCNRRDKRQSDQSALVRRQLRVRQQQVDAVTKAKAE